MGFTNLLIVCAVALLAPLAVRLAPALRIPSPVLEILAGIVLGPSVLGWVHADVPVQVLALIGLAFLLFLAGLEIDVHRLAGRSLRLALGGFVVSFALAVGVGLLLGLAGFTTAPLLLAIVLCATSLGLVVPVLKDAGELTGTTGQLIVAAASIADFGAVILLSLFFSEESTGVAARLLLLIGLLLVAALAVLALMRAEHSARAMRVLGMLADTTAQIRIRFAVVLLVALVALAHGLGFEAILGAFLAGAALRLIDPAADVTHPQTELKLDAIGYGLVIPVFFVASGIGFDAQALVSTPGALLQVPLFLAALFMVRAVPALLYGRTLGRRRAVAAGFLQATSLPFIVAAVMIGERLGALSPATGAALISAGLVSVLVFPAVALAVLRGGDRPPEAHIPVPRTPDADASADTPDATPTGAPGEPGPPTRVPWRSRRRAARTVRP